MKKQIHSQLKLALIITFQNYSNISRKKKNSQNERIVVSFKYEQKLLEILFVNIHQCYNAIEIERPQ